MKEPKKERNLKLVEGKWYVDFTFNGRRIRQFGDYTKDQARNVLAKLRIGKLDESLGFKRSGSDELVPFDKFSKDFLELYSKQNKKSWPRDESSLKVLKQFFRGATLQDIGPEQVERFKAKRKAEALPATVNRELACLKTMFSKAVEWGKVTENPVKAVKKFKENNVKERILNSAEARRLVECAGPGIRPILIVALNTGMGRNEILSLKWQDVNFVKGFILIEDSKSGKSRKIPMNVAVFEALKGLPRSSEYVFFNPETKDHVKDIKRAFSTACKNAEIKGLRLHDLRHTAASKMIEAGVDLVMVSKILGHSSIQMTMRYAHPTPENMRRAAEKLGEILGSAKIKDDGILETVVVFRPIKPTKIGH